MVEITFGLGAKKKIHHVSLSNNTVRRQIDDMVANVCQQVCSEIKLSALQASIQLGESTDSALESDLIVFARYEKDKRIKENFLFSNTLSATTTAADVNAVVNSFFEANKLSWQNFKHICTDGTPVIIDVKSGFVTPVKNEKLCVTSLHCCLHQYTLATKILPLHLMKVMDVAVKAINFICSRIKKHSLFQLLSQEMGVQLEGILFVSMSQISKFALKE